MNRSLSRLAGALYLVPTLLGPFSMMYVPAQVLVPGDAAATTQHLAEHAGLFRLGLVSDLVIVLAEVALTAVLFTLFREAGRTLALAAAAARFLMAGVQAANVIVSLAALQWPGSALEVLGLHGQAVHAWEALFALHCVLLGVLVARAGHSVMGGLVGLAGLGYALNAFGSVALPSLAPVLAGIVGLTAVVGEVPFVFWLLLRRA